MSKKKYSKEFKLKLINEHLKEGMYLILLYILSSYHLTHMLRISKVLSKEYIFC